MTIEELYKQAEQRQLKKEYRFLRENDCKRKIPLGDDFTEESFVKAAPFMGYKIGMKPYFEDGEVVAHISNVKFKNLKSLHNPFAKKHYLKWCAVIPSIKSHGLDLDSLGWSYLLWSDMSHRKFLSLLRKKSIDEIVDGRLSAPDTKVCLVNYKGQDMPISRALDDAGICVRSYYICLHENNGDRQKTFDQMLDEKSKIVFHKDTAGNGYLFLPRFDVDTLEMKSKACGKPIAEIFNGLLMSLVEY